MGWYTGSDAVLPFLKLALFAIVLVVLNLTAESVFYYYCLNIVWYCLLLTGSYFGAVSMFFATTNEEMALEFMFKRDRIYARDSFFVIEQKLGTVYFSE